MDLLVNTVKANARRVAELEVASSSLSCSLSSYAKHCMQLLLGWERLNQSQRLRLGLPVVVTMTLTISLSEAGYVPGSLVNLIL